MRHDQGRSQGYMLKWRQVQSKASRDAFQRHLSRFTSLIFIVLSFYCYEITFCQFSIQRILDYNWIGLGVGRVPRKGLGRALLPTEKNYHRKN